MIRVANARHNIISRATARLWIIREEESAEGQHFRRYYELELLRNENPVFALTWTLFHAISVHSPLYDMSPDHLAQADALLVLTVSVDDNSSQQRERGGVPNGAYIKRTCRLIIGQSRTKRVGTPRSKLATCLMRTAPEHT
jgi:hypothetical protein